MNRRIKQVWLLAILSSFLLIGLQTYWLYNSVTYSMGEMGKKNAEKAEQAIVTYQTNIGAAVKEKSHIGYVVTAYFSDYKRPVYNGLLSAGYGYNHRWSGVSQAGIRQRDAEERYFRFA